MGRIENVIALPVAFYSHACAERAGIFNVMSGGEMLAVSASLVQNATNITNIALTLTLQPHEKSLDGNF